MRWGVSYSPKAVQGIHKIPRGFAGYVTLAIRALQEDPWPENAQPTEEDPSAYWIAVVGDHTVTYEILDEQHTIRILKIE